MQVALKRQDPSLLALACPHSPAGALLFTTDYEHMKLLFLFCFLYTGECFLPAGSVFSFMLGHKMPVHEEVCLKLVKRAGVALGPDPKLCLQLSPGELESPPAGKKPGTGVRRHMGRW